MQCNSIYITENIKNWIHCNKNFDRHLPAVNSINLLESPSRSPYNDSIFVLTDYMRMLG